MSTLIPYCYVFIRTDIPLADQGVQIGHATLEAGKFFKHPDNTHMIVLQLPGQEELNEAGDKLMMRDIEFVKFFEPDDEMGHTAIATEPVYGSKRKLFQKYELWQP